MKILAGKLIKRVSLSNDKRAIQFEDTNGVKYTFQAIGDCCASAYINSTEGFQCLRDRVITKVDEDAVHLWNDGECDVGDAIFYSIKTACGSAFIELRIEHNGYYGGLLCWIDFDPAEYPEEYVCGANKNYVSECNNVEFENILPTDNPDLPSRQFRLFACIKQSITQFKL